MVRRSRRRTGRASRRSGRAARRAARRTGRAARRTGRRTVNVSKTLTLPDVDDDDWDAKTSELGSGWRSALKSKSKSKKGLEDVADDFMDKFGDLAAKGVKQAADVVKPKKSKGKRKGKGKPSQYNLFVKKMLPELRKQFPNKQQKDLFKLVGEAWKKQK